jgi:hypothetical protein
MTVLTTTYGAQVDLSPTDVDLAAGVGTTTPIYTNGAMDGTISFVDVLVGGEVTMAVTPVAGDTIEFYILAQHTLGTATDFGGGIGALMGADALQVEGTDYAAGNLILLNVVSMETAIPGQANLYHWGPVSVASAFGGVVPKQWMIFMLNNTAAATTACVITTYGIQYTST